jgi:hypothetical protein
VVPTKLHATADARTTRQINRAIWRFVITATLFDYGSTAPNFHSSAGFLLAESQLEATTANVIGDTP